MISKEEMMRPFRKRDPIIAFVRPEESVDLRPFLSNASRIVVSERRPKD